MTIPRLPVADLVKILLQYQPTPAHMWFLGAGASVSSGVPASGDIVFEMLAMEYAIKTHAALIGPRFAREHKIRRWAKRNLSWFDPNRKKSEYVQVMENVIRDQAARDRFLEDHFKNAR